MTYQQRQWTNPSVIALAQGADPVTAIQATARQTVVDAVERGWDGPPYDPFYLAEMLDISVLPSDDVVDARTVPVSGGLRIEFNPNRPHGRMRYSVAHEIAHTLFPDCAENVRNRAPSDALREDDWELELLCNIGAAELLMPTGYTDLENEGVDIDNILSLRRKFDVSTEAILIRMAKLTSHACAVFAAARIDQNGGPPAFRIDYRIPSRTSNINIPANFRIESSNVLAECTAIGFTAKGTESWGGQLPAFDVQCVGIPPFPGDRFPRIAGVVTSEQVLQSSGLQIEYLVGDAREARGTGKRVIAHIVNDGTARWGAGFALQVAKEWSFIQEEFQEWVNQDRRNLSLGKVHCAKIDDDLSIVHMVAQKGYGPSGKPRIRYADLGDALGQLHEIASSQGASVHMPRIGTGQAGGNWELIRDLVDEHLVRRGTPVFVYALPRAVPAHVQRMFDF
jgi:O-acetyl-ADP-ribose deacetylase (regulator of RNase III)